MHDDALAALLEASLSPDVEIRADAGRQLAAWAERSPVAATLRRLVLDAYNTYVTDVVARALLERDDVRGVRVLAQAAAHADAEQQDHLYWVVQERQERVLELCAVAAPDEDLTTRAGAALLQDWLS
ncbi:hypothetical protein [Jiangella anatolica]|uniref:HEAT repeat domain-containing protein n=1 Tax=Jiangella anatolica TaxID=2670374 RepID=A0A2W2BGM4_9ACTN|nr:hypothetical protein [Jiangella anatolica]PZF84440.1 hypothetical protein C1I92_08400 [Jiangella anatolica]